LHAWIGSLSSNVIVYATYYGANLLVDFVRFKNQYSPKSSSATYHIKDLGLEEPTVVRSSDFLFTDKKQKENLAKEDASRLSASKNESQVIFNAPIERQGICDLLSNDARESKDLKKTLRCYIFNLLSRFIP
jgi:hypothetical protein